MYYKDNTNIVLNLFINYLIISLLKVKVSPKSESKFYNYNKILKCTNINSKYYSIIINILFMLLFILTIICVTMQSCMMKFTNKWFIKYIYKT